ncbi:MAG: 2-hydroxyacyl-CoA dehydratase [Candidatus Firestonebacteria bacterium]|nr:2-hydroxyacyl-CoA dehydratase [Candidatus Firestonebacteria bacterium]
MPIKPEAVGITSTIPVEVLVAAKVTPVDLNNRFIATPDPQALLDEAEREGIPRNTCAWVKGLYATIRRSNLTTVLGVVQGDCTHLQSMLEALLPELSTFVPFAYPFDKNRYLLRFEIEKIMEIFGVQWDEVRAAKKRLDFIRALAHEVDRRTWQGNLISGRDNFEVLVNCSDFKGDPDGFQTELEEKLKTAQTPYPAKTLRLGLLGVPAIFSDLFEFLEEYGARVVFNEVPRQFAMPNYRADVLDQYLAYTYPYSIYGRVADIAEQARLRKLDGYIHYVQSFCHHQIEDMTFKKQLALPMLTLEGDRPGPLDGRSRTRVEAFLEMLRQPGAKSARRK